MRVFMSPMLSEWAESRVYISDDSTHDNEFWKHCAEDTIKVYKGRIHADGRELTHVHFWCVLYGENETPLKGPKKR
jgi:hypothetical protein